MKFIFTYITKHGLAFLAATFFITIEAFSELIQPLILARIVDIGVASGDGMLVLKMGGVMLFIAGVGAIGAVSRNYLSAKTSQQVAKEIRSSLYKKVQSFSVDSIERMEPAVLITRITSDVTQIQNFINSCMRVLVRAPILCVGAIGFIIMETPRQSPVLLGIICLVGLIVAVNMKLGYPRFARMQKRLESLNEICRQYFSSIRVIKAFVQEEREIHRFAAASDDLEAHTVAANRISALSDPAIRLTVNFGIVALLWIGGYAGGEIGKLMASINYMTQVLFAMSMVTHMLNNMVRASASANRVEEILKEESEQVPLAPEKMMEPTGDIAFCDLWFKYRGAADYALENINLSIKSGTTCGIIGSTGAGKTSLIHLLMGFYTPDQGRICIDGQDIALLPKNMLRARMAMVSQKSLLFSGTLLDNLKWGKDNATKEEAEKAAALSMAATFIPDLKDGYDTVLGQGGVNLSGGQKQRVAIARALVREPAILLLDDCTSALDAATERRVLENILKTTASKTCLLISQRISTVMHTDLIVCMENGKIVGSGTHKALLDTCKVYREIYASQIGGDL